MIKPDKMPKLPDSHTELLKQVQILNSSKFSKFKINPWCFFRKGFQDRIDPITE